MKIKSIGFLSILITFLGCTLARQVRSADFFYDVTRVAVDDVLSLRSQAGSKTQLLARISANARFLNATGKEKYVGKSTWVQIQYLQYIGWVNKRYLVPSKTVKFTTLTCLGTEPYWSLDIKLGKVIQRDIDENETSYALSGVNASINHTNRWMLQGAARGTTDLAIALWKTGSCSDDMSERTYQYEIMYSTPGGSVFSGCCNVIK